MLLYVFTLPCGRCLETLSASSNAWMILVFGNAKANPDNKDHPSTYQPTLQSWLILHKVLCAMCPKCSIDQTKSKI